MAKKATKPVEEMAEEKERNALYQAARRVLLAGMGAVALAQEEGEDFVQKLVDRGEIAEKDARKLVREMVEKRKKETQKAENHLDKQLEELLTRMNVPTKSDIQALSDKIAALAHKVDELKKPA